MPRKDGTGPMGQGKMSGRGLGFCNKSEAQENEINPGMGRSMGQGMGQGAGRGRRSGACSNVNKRCSRGFGRGM